ncbi:MAG: sugar ABC transporter permease [Lachnospiraceae bacterium]|nr:sugar ABC transporter permease [Lachnospiraceae bacterium]
MKVKKRGTGTSVVRTAPKKKWWRDISHWQLTLMLLPGIIYTFVFNYWPMPGIVMAFKEFKPRFGIWGSPWVGFDNFKFLFESTMFWRLMRNTVLYNVAYILTGLFFPIFFALCLERIRKKWSLKILQSSFLLPNFISIIIVSFLVYAFLSPDAGFINNLIVSLGGKPISFYSESKYWPFILVFVDIWKGTGFSTLIYYGTIMGIDQNLYDAAEIDGASELKKIRYVTLPHLKTIVMLILINSMGGLLNSATGLHYNVTMNSGALLPTTDVLGTYVMRGLLNSTNYGGSSAIAFFTEMFGFVMVLVTNAIVRKVDPDSAMF